MTPKRFPSKIDSWLVILLVGVILTQVVIVSIAIVEDPEPGAAIVGVGSLVLIVALFGSILKFTYYEVSDVSLKIVSGPFRWKIARDAITAAEPSRSLLSSPALSLDRLRIRHGKRSVLVSPADKRGFLKALGFDPSGEPAAARGKDE